MKWNGKDIKDLSKDEIREALASCGDMDNYRFDKLGAKCKRHIKIFEKHPPTENPAFTQLINELNEQLGK